ncbi:MAG: single-stranded-DNA-specific exonuclease RecJ [Planctomycetota bacterium]|jgi:single-stranded-DNA-specific exonuclease
MPLAARTQKKQWVIKPTDANSNELANSLKVSPLLAQVLINRGVTDSDVGFTFLRPKLTDLISPEKMPGIKDAVDRITLAVKNKEKITVYGDYDVDGITGVSILWQLLKLLDADVDYYIPHRVDEGYGLNDLAIRSLAKLGTQLLITVDCGINAFSSAQLIHELGMEVVITDHHRPEEQLPKASAIVHPMIEESYENQNSAGAMVAFKLAWALANKFKNGQKLKPEMRQFMLSATTLAAMGTVADVMDLRGENRVLTSYGLKALPDCKLSGIQALLETTALLGKQGLEAYHIGFRLAPMLNAAGRMGHARLAVELLTSDNHIRSLKIAQYLKDQNQLRQKCERKIFKRACEMINQQGLNHPDNMSIVLSDENWHTGVIGIVASRVIDKYFRPTIMINSTQKIAQGSARSIAGFDILKAISSCSDHLESFGGHKMAAGLKIKSDNIESFAKKLENYAKENLTEGDVIAKMHIDAEVKLSQLTHQAVDELKMLGPFGRGNPKPIFATKGVQLASPPRTCGAKNDHLQLTITDNTSTIRSIGFGMGKLEKKLLENEFFNIAYQPNINTYNGNSNVQLVLDDIQFA